MSSIDGPALPPEIIDAIIDQVHLIGPVSRVKDQERYHKRRETLGACSLASRSWLTRSRFYLFETVFLPPNDVSRCSAFAAMLAHPLCTFTSYVRTLIIREAHSLSGLGTLWLNDALPHLSLLTHVRTLSITGARFDRMRSDTWSESGISFFAKMGMKRLQLLSCQFRTPDQCLDALSVCGHLEELTLRRTALDMDLLLGMHILLGPPPVPPPRLTKLRLDSHRLGNYDAVLRWLASTPIITHLILERITDTETLAVADFVEKLGPSLEVLDLNVVDVNEETATQDAFCRYVDLSHNTRLRSLAFDQLILAEPYQARLTAAKHIPQVIDRVSSEIKELILRVQINSTDDLDLIDWDIIVYTINSKRNWGSLESIVVSGPRKEILEESEHWMKKRLQGLKGNVNVTCTLLPTVMVGAPAFVWESPQLMLLRFP
ncbi:uncharacterized protein BT62DRAFT_931024 [Guyanagaster necrorhizus]|uniref:F-box domain-containing protein n=1 Tax=Guyanagaster necrorhizus TaxID=856835 RepID=A0A9P7VV91_9AGAR|nr:uncharacterized protein BT62DRAFT_931024 [Guyanagaster necrorhizus MCA 3950]KAG7447192.1 hypothetical protein BT62DRAFT_931024 [Guyanagaster necrorhizus MCA 3950]